MSKDGTNRGGVRPGAGRKPRTPFEKIMGGAVTPYDLPEADDLEACDTPPVREYMKERQKDGSTLLAEDIFRETWRWIRSKGCEGMVSRQMVEQYAVSVARWIQCEEAISRYGYISKHPTTGAPIASPYVAMSRDFKKQVNADWFLIYSVVRENCAADFSGPTPQDDVMELLLRKREGR